MSTARDYHYYLYEDVLCRVWEDEEYGERAEGYFPGSGFRPVEAFDPQFHGTPLSERAFKDAIAQLLTKSK